jgi:hypothetical protein
MLKKPALIPALSQEFLDESHFYPEIAALLQEFSFSKSSSRLTRPVKEKLAQLTSGTAAAEQKKSPSRGGWGFPSCNFR